MAQYYAELVGGPKDGAKMYLDTLPRYWYVPTSPGWRLCYEYRMEYVGSEMRFFYDYLGHESTEERINE